MSIDAMKQALAALEGWANHGDWVWPESALEQAKRNTTESITALRAAIEQAPWVKTYAGGKPNYTAPRQWQGLTDDERNQFRQWAHPEIIDAIELKLRERNP